MAFYINDQVLDFNTLKTADGSFYKGNDEIKGLLAGAWEEIEKKFFKKGIKVIFKTPGIRSGIGKGNQGYSYSRSVSYPTRKGKVRVTWADNQVNEGGQIKYTPVLKRMGLNHKTLILGPEDIEEILFMYLFNTHLISPKNPSGRTYLEDKEVDALKYEEAEKDAAVVSYWLFRKESPLYANEPMISTLCLAWGINPDNKSISYRKQLLAEAVKRCEKKKELEFNLSAFNKVCEKLKDGQDTTDIDIMALIQKCISGKVIKYEQDKLSWVLLGIEGNVLKTICKVPPQMVNSNRNVLKKHLMGSPDDVQTLRSAVSDESIPSRHDQCVLSAPLPDDVTLEYIENEMSWHDKKRIYKFLGHDPQGKNMDTIQPILIEYFVVQKRTIDFIVKK